ncbi:unnamed protein product, partial [Cyprideis torosa]
DLGPCLRQKSLEELLNIRVPTPDFRPNFGPFIDGNMIMSNPEHLLRKYRGDFDEMDLLLGVTTAESYLDFNEKEIEYGFEEEKRDKILRTFVRNVYDFHLTEIFATIVSEYTNWERVVKHPISTRDALVEVLSDGHTVAPMTLSARYHSKRSKNTYFYVFEYQDSHAGYPQEFRHQVVGHATKNATSKN